jgi:hypothetical protein
VVGEEGLANGFLSSSAKAEHGIARSAATAVKIAFQLDLVIIDTSLSDSKLFPVLQTRLACKATSTGEL